MIVTPDFIPHKHFHKGSWLIEKDNPNWYYFYPKRKNNFNYEKNFYQTLDEPLKKVVKYLHQIGLNTTPSCAGHFYPERSFENIYDQLDNQRKKIQNKGLILQNPETGEFYRYRNEDYVLPWDKDYFVNRAEDYQSNGCLGIKSPNKNTTLHLTDKPIKEFKTLYDKNNNVIIFLTKSDSVKDRNDKWDYFTEKMMNLF